MPRWLRCYPTPLQAFNTPFSTQLRVIDREGQPWFVAQDVCEALGLYMKAGTGQHTKKLNDDEKASMKLVHGTTGVGGNPYRTVISESGLYKLILRSDKPEARKFKDWVTGVVLPAPCHLTDQP